MYGLIYSTIQSLVVNKVCMGDDSKWKEICLQAGVKEAEFMNYQCYDEECLDKLVNSACNVLGIPLETLMEKFGEHFFEKTKESGHSYMLYTLGHNLFGFLVNLDSLHSHLSTTYLEMRAPSFQCEKTDEGLQLHYYSCRPGLQCIVIGIVKAVAKDFFKLDLDMTMEMSEKLEGVWLCNHYMFNITVKESSRNDHSWIERLQGERVNNQPGLPLSNRNSAILELEDGPHTSSPLPLSGLAMGYSCPFVTLTNTDDHEQELHRLDEEDEDNVEEDEDMSKPEETSENKTATMAIRSQLFGLLQPAARASPPISLLPHLSINPGQSRRGSIFIPSDDWPINPNLFRILFPFHVIFDSNFVIKYIGISLSRIFPNALNMQAKLTDYFTIERPAIPAFTYQHIRSRAHNEFVLQTKGMKNKYIQFRGQMVPTSSQPNSPIIFIASPRVRSIKELEDQGLYLSDIPVHDVTRDLILLNHQLRAEMNTASQLELMKYRLEEEKTRVQIEKERADVLLHAMLPETVAKQLKLGEEARATFHSEVSILFSDIEGFTTICSQCDHPVKVLKMLNDLYTGFDNYIDECKVYKVETIGDAYMVAAGLLDTAQDHGYAVTSFSFKMRTYASGILSPTTGQPLKIRIGIHTGAVMAGVVGMKMPRYCLFGDAVNVANRMESHGEAGKVHVSTSTSNTLIGKPVSLTSRGAIYIKGLQTLQKTYFVEPSVMYDVTERTSGPPLKEPDSFVSLHVGTTPRSSFSIHSPKGSIQSDKHPKLSVYSKTSGLNFEVDTVPNENDEEMSLSQIDDLHDDTVQQLPVTPDIQLQGSASVALSNGGVALENGRPPNLEGNKKKHRHSRKHRHGDKHNKCAIC